MLAGWVGDLGGGGLGYVQCFRDFDVYFNCIGGGVG